MQQVASFPHSSSIHRMKLMVDETLDPSGESQSSYYEAVVESFGTNPRFPTAFVKKVVVINTKLFSDFANRDNAEVVIFADYEAVRWMRLEEQNFEITGQGKRSWAALHIGIEPIVSRRGVSVRIVTILLQEAKF